MFKRFFPVPQLYLGLCFGWGVPMAFAATLGVVPRAGWVLLLAAVLWAGVYDTFYAMADRADDQRIGVRSSAISFGDMDLLIIGSMQVMMLLALLLVGRSLELGARYYAAASPSARCCSRCTCGWRAAASAAPASAPSSSTTGSAWPCSPASWWSTGRAGWSGDRHRCAYSARASVHSSTRAACA